MTALLTSLITVIGVLAGTWIGNVLSRQASREQVLFTRAHERREEIISRLYGLILTTRGSFQEYIRVLDPHIEDRLENINEEYRQHLQEQHKKAEDKLKDHMDELRHYYRMNAIWLEPSLCDEIETVIDAEFRIQYYELYFVDISDLQERRIVTEEARRWMKQEAEPAIKRLEQEFRTTLGVVTRTT